MFHDTLELRFPPLVGPTPSAPLSGFSAATPSDYLYLRGAYDAGAGSIAPPYVTQVDPNVHDRLLANRTQLFADGDANLRRYLGFVLSQNYLNQFINTRWKEGAFNFTLGPTETQQFGQLIGSVIGVPLQKSSGLRVHLWPAASPRTVLTPRGLDELGPYAATFFDDMRICIELENRETDIAEVQFAAEAFTQVGFGGIDPVTQRLDLGQFLDAFFELYFDLDHLGVRLVEPEAQGLIVRGPTFGRLTIVDLPALEPALLIAVRAAFASRSDTAVPHAVADRWRLRYTIGPAGSLDVRFFPYRGNLYGWLALVGAQIPGLDPGNHGIVDLLPGGTQDATDKDKFTCGLANLVLLKS